MCWATPTSPSACPGPEPSQATFALSMACRRRGSSAIFATGIVCADGSNI
jgi:hypothetical protein